MANQCSFLITSKKWFSNCMVIKEFCDISNINFQQLYNGFNSQLSIKCNDNNNV